MDFGLRRVRSAMVKEVNHSACVLKASVAENYITVSVF